MTQLPISGTSATEVVQSVERAIRDGVFSPGESLPTVRALALQLGLAPGTVASAYKTLRSRGQIRTAGRNGSVVSALNAPPGRTPPRLRPGLVDLASGAPDLALLPDLSAALLSLRGPAGIYPDNPVHPALADAARVRLEKDKIPARWLTVVGGALDGIERVLQARLRPGDRVGVEDPGYPPLFSLLGALGLEAVPIKTDAGGMSKDSLAAALASRIQAVVITPRAQNPGGCALDCERAVQIRELLGSHSPILVVEDDHAGEVAGAELHSVVGHSGLASGLSLGDGRAGGKWVHIRSVSKSLGPDLRLAVVAGDQETVGLIEERRSLGTGWVPYMLQQVVNFLWNDPAVEQSLKVASELYSHRRKALQDALEVAGIEALGVSGMNLWVPVADEHGALDSLEQAGFAASAGQRFRIASPPGIRINTARLDPALATEVAAALAASSAGFGQHYQP